MQLELSPQECDLLIEILQSYIQDLRLEIRGTDSTPYKKQLKDEMELLERLITRLRALQPSVTTS